MDSNYYSLIEELVRSLKRMIRKSDHPDKYTLLDLLDGVLAVKDDGQDRYAEGSAIDYLLKILRRLL
jgi:hypothetical protein